MRLFILLAALFAYSAANAQTSYVAYKRCYTELNNACVVTLADDFGSIDSIYLNASDNISPDAAMVQEFADLNIELKVVDNTTFTKFANASTDNATVYNLEQEITLLTDIPDEQWAAYAESALCVAAGASCGYGVFSTFVTGGAALFFARVGCAATGIACISAIRSWNKWENYQRRKRNAEKLKNTPKPADSSSTGGAGVTGSINPGVGTGGLGTPIGTGREEEVTITEW
ncbi:MAG TPA: hypothetical protein VE954_36355 [Oligoflexus sp.]|uniref:hypothetical protein n=1 Tax=Oligoflexus sp. TaxID=1971216 RepID=UPI002D441F13|nr:hypothetical protein [Oligoflexus sp.]HYX38608.1 hypothetical protein [Oligoflexus sp.]